MNPFNHGLAMCNANLNIAGFSPSVACPFVVQQLSGGGGNVSERRTSSFNER
jgi:hypothetical protein